MIRMNKLSTIPQKYEYKVIGHQRKTNAISSYETFRLGCLRTKHTKSPNTINGRAIIVAKSPRNTNGIMNSLFDNSKFPIKFDD